MDIFEETRKFCAVSKLKLLLGIYGYFWRDPKIGKVVFEKEKEISKVAKIKIDIATLESKINDYKKIGDIVYKETIDAGNEEVKKIVKKNYSLRVDINNKKEMK